MAYFYQFETVDFPIEITTEGALVDYSKIIVSIKQNDVQIDKDDSELGIDLDKKIINLHLSQEETGRFKKGTAKLQVNIYYENTERDTSNEVKITVKDNLYDEIIS